jgi:PAS domain S-box-containing protein
MGGAMYLDISVFLSLLNNLSIFIVLVAGYGFFVGYLKKYSPRKRQIVLGVFFGLVAIGSMHVKIPVADGVIVDQRNAVVALSGAFGGPISAILSAIMAGAYRVYLGGAGSLAGVFGVCLSAAGGFLLFRLRGRMDGAPKIAFGALVVTIIILPGFLLVGDLANGWDLTKRMAFPYGSAIFVGLFLGSLLLAREDRRHSVEAAKKLSDDRYREIVEGTDDLITIVDGEGNFRFVNHMAMQIFGVPAEDCVGLSAFEFVHPDDRDTTVAAFRDWLEKKETHVNYENRQQSRDGAVHSMWWTIDIHYDASGEVSSINGTARDITAKKLLEQKLLGSQRLEAIGQLTGGVAHDFNNLLAVMIGNAEALEDRIGDDEKAKQHVEALIKAVDRGSSLTTRLLAFSRQQPLVPEPTDISSLITSLDDMLKRTLGETIDLRVFSTQNLWPGIIDASQLEHALVNLAINARDAMPEGGTLTIETANATLDETYAEQYEEVTLGDYVMVDVSDTGTGIPPEILEKVFEPFFTTKDVGEGSGLGLSMVYGFAKQSNGHITIYSEVGHGTTVKLYMPRSQEVVAQQDSKDDLTEFARGSERILVVEDDAGVREVPAKFSAVRVTRLSRQQMPMKRLPGLPPMSWSTVNMMQTEDQRWRTNGTSLRRLSPS